MNILITGGTGFIGHNVVARLQAQHDVPIMDNQTTYGIIPQAELTYLIEERSKKVNYKALYLNDICDDRAVHKIVEMELPDVIIHMASFPRQKVVNANPALGADVMIKGLLNLLESAKKHKIRRFVYISSSMVYGDFDDNVTEDYLCNPQGQYGIMKLCGEQLVKDYARRTGMEYTIIRPSAVYGPLDVNDRVISKFMIAAMRGETLKVHGGSEALDFTYVDDVSDGIVMAALNNNTVNKTYNITKSHSVTLAEAAGVIVGIVGKGHIEIQDRDLDFPKRGLLNIDAARKDFMFDPKVDVKEGFEKYYNWLLGSTFHICH